MNQKENLIKNRTQQIETGEKKSSWKKFEIKFKQQKLEILKKSIICTLNTDLWKLTIRLKE